MQHAPVNLDSIFDSCRGFEAQKQVCNWVDKNGQRSILILRSPEFDGHNLVFDADLVGSSILEGYLIIDGSYEIFTSFFRQ